jgi:hypothetical protein
VSLLPLIQLGIHTFCRPRSLNGIPERGGLP